MGERARFLATKGHFEIIDFTAYALLACYNPLEKIRFQCCNYRFQPFIVFLDSILFYVTLTSIPYDADSCVSHLQWMYKRTEKNPAVV